MLAAARTLVTAAPAARTFISLYSTVTGITPKKWRIGTISSPPLSLKEDENEDTRPAPPQRKRQPRVPTSQAVLAYKATLKESFPEGWDPRRKVSRDAMDGMRSMHAQDPKTFTTAVLARTFKVSPEAVRRILKSKWAPTPEKRARMIERERRSRMEWITQRRLEERRKQLEIEETLGVVRGRNKKDKLSLT